MRNTKSAFTLVELIVVITILAILGTIAFISLQGYSAEARNSKRIQDLSSISSALNIKLTKGMSVMAAVNYNADNANTSLDIAGTTTGTGSNYNAGTVNYTALEMKASEFSDPNGDEYVIGATTYAGGPFQLAASVEEDGEEVAKLVGNYNARITGSDAVDGITGSGYTNNNSIKIDLTKSGLFKAGDTLATYGEITKISADGTTLYLSGSSVTAGNLPSVALALAEDASLLYGTTTEDVDGVITDAGEYLPY